MWSFRDNACDIPTDCPHRERAGWTGDWQLYVPTAAFLYDVAGFSTKWLRDVAADQWPDGTRRQHEPRAARPRAGTARSPFLNGSAGWGDAAVHRAVGAVPGLRRRADPRRAVADAWSRWLDRAERMAREQRHPDRAARRPEPAPHERYLWDTGFHWGEWLRARRGPGRLPARSSPPTRATSRPRTSRYSAGLMARIAAAARPGRATPTATPSWPQTSAAAWQAEYLDADGRLTPDTQANHVRALAFDLVPDELRPAVADRLVELIREADTHLGTGFLATPYLLPVLADTGHLDVAYELLLPGHRAVLAGR